VTRVRWIAIEEVIAVAAEAAQELMSRYGEGFRSPSGDHRETAPLRGARAFLDRAVQMVLGERRRRAAVRAANKRIVRGLAKLNPEIPVLSRAGNILAHAERRAWNHLWLVDPLDGEGAFGSGSSDFSINIALIEDGRPIYGVVYAPATDTIYYAVTGKAAYRRVDGGNAERLVPDGDLSRAATAAVGASGPGAPAKQVADGSSHALAMCTLCTKAENNVAAFQPSMEWQTAAAEPILSCVGMRVRASESGRELGYNKEDLSNGHVRVDRVDATASFHA